MREIKFRAWLKAGSMVIIDSMRFEDCGPFEVSYVSVGGFVETVDIQKDVISVMQFTGLKDKNGNEIYEGDVVKLQECGDVLRYSRGEEVHYFNGGFSPFNDHYQELGDIPDAEKWEVIGNIYENPELVKQ